jgi:hypothetical protein
VSPEESTFESESESQRLAGYLEVGHLVSIASGKWERYWKGTLGIFLKEPLMTGLFFQDFALHAGGTIIALTYALTCLPPLVTIYRRLYRGNRPWPFNLITKCETDRVGELRLRKFHPRSDFLISKSNLPRLLVQVNSKPKQDSPEDLVRMLLSGAAVVRFANKFLNRFMKAKNFVLFAIYIWDNGRVTRYSLFQEPNDSQVC